MVVVSSLRVVRRARGVVRSCGECSGSGLPDCCRLRTGDCLFLFTVEQARPTEKFLNDISCTGAQRLRRLGT